MTTKIVTKVAAFFKYPMGKPVMKSLKHGDSIILEREPTNAYDPNAIKIIVEQIIRGAVVLIENGKETEIVPETEQFIQIGYVPAPIAAKIAKSRIISCTKTGPNFDEITIEIEE